MSEELALWHDFYVSLVTAAAGLLGLLFVISLGIGFLGLFPQSLNALGIELVVLNLAAVIPFVRAAGRGLRAQGVGYRRSVTVSQFVIGLAVTVTTIVASLDVAGSDANGLFVIAGIAVSSLLWGVFNTWELIFRVAKLD